MSTAAQTIERPETGIVALVEANPVMVLTDRQTFNRFYEEIKRETDALDADVSTEKGRKAIASMAYKVARTKTAIDDAGKKLNEEARARINAVDESRREIRVQLDALQMIQHCRDCGNGIIGGASQSFGILLHELEHKVVAEIERFGDFAADVETARTDALTRVRQVMEKGEADRKARAEAEEKARIEAAAKAAEEAARVAAETKAREEREAAERAHAKALAAEKRRADEAEAARKAEAERIAREKAAEEAEAKRIADEQAAREADRAHRGKIMGAAKEAIMEAGPVNEAAARNIVLAIAARRIPNVSIQF